MALQINMNIKIFVLLLLLSQSLCNPISNEEDGETTVGTVFERVEVEEVNFDVETTEAPKSNEVFSDDVYADDEEVFKKFKYPTVPEELPSIQTENRLEDAIPEDFDFSSMNISVVRMKNPTSEILSGRSTSCQCGRPGERTIPLRIVNGTVVRINEYPWTVALVRRPWIGEATGAYCGGTLINNRYVLTASHCVDGMNPRRIEVRIHEEDFASQTETEGGTQRVLVEKFIMHPFYNRRTIDNDIALVKLIEPVRLDNVVVPACLPANNDYTFEGVEGTAAGWGATAEGGSVSSTLMKVDVPIISNSECNSKTMYVGKITDNMLCAGNVVHGGVDSCQGDSGGPLTIENGGRRTLVGIVSWGYGCARPKSPGVYSRVGRYTEWILANTKGAQWCSA